MEHHLQLSFIDTQAEPANLPNLPNLANVPNLPNSVKIKNSLNVSQFKIFIFISFGNVLNL